MIENPTFGSWEVTSPPSVLHAEPPPVVGYWVLYPQVECQTKFSMTHKPTPEQIANTTELLGWGWEDAT